MLDTRRLLLVDDDARRRAELCADLGASDLDVEAFATPADLPHDLPESGLILAHDGGSAIRRAAERVRASPHAIPLIAYANAPETDQIAEAVLEGAIGYLGWPFGKRDVSASLDAAAKRIRQLRRTQLLAAEARMLVGRLTQREREVLTEVAAGLTNRRIGEKLRISPRTVEIHRSRLLARLNLSHTSQAIRIAVLAGLVNDDVPLTDSA